MHTISKILLSLLILSTVLISCKKEPSPPKSLLIYTKDIDSITFNTAASGGSISSDGRIVITKRGLCWSTNSNPTVNPSGYSFYTIDGKGDGVFSSLINGLKAGTIYFARSYATTSDGNTYYGNEKSFITPYPSLSTITTVSFSSVTSNSAIINYNISNDGGAAITQRGVCWSNYTSTPTINNSNTIDGYGLGTFNSTLNGLNPNTTYFVRAYAYNSAGLSYGNVLSFTTKSGIPSVSTLSISSITSNSAIGQGNVTSDSGASVTQRGICWTTYPTIPTRTNGNASSDGTTGLGSFTTSLLNLIPGTTYNFRAFATNSNGTAYGTVVSFTSSSIAPPTITTTSISSITTTTANTGGTISSDGGATVTQRGVCWSTSSSTLTTAYNKTSNGSGTGSFTTNLTGLSPNTYYYARAYAINSAGTSYGNIYTFNTLQASLPSIVTTSVSSIAQNSALSGGTISSDGGSPVTQRGICWSIYTNPTIANSSTSVGSGTGSFSSTMTGLSANTIYSVRAYATNSVGTAYGNQYNFQTTAAATIPTVTTNTISSITQTTAISGGNVTSNGGAAIIAEGVCWSSTTTNPTIANSITSDGTITGTFSSSVSGLLPSAQYYLRAYATNSVGTAYGNLNTFITSAALTAPQLLIPQPGITISCCSTTLKWSNVSGATDYEVYISNINTFSGSNYNISSCSGTLYPQINYTNIYTSVTSTACIKIGGTQNNNKWYWKVRARSSSYTGPWSSTYYYIY